MSWRGAERKERTERGERERGKGDGTAGLDGLLAAGSGVIRDYEG